MMGWPHHHHDHHMCEVILKMVNIQGVKLIIQGEKRAHHLSKGFPIIIKCSVLKPSAIMLWLQCPKVWVPAYLSTNMTISTKWNLIFPSSRVPEV
jgi:hypothetical protein